jgi:hypothetical protein
VFELFLVAHLEDRQGNGCGEDWIEDLQGLARLAGLNKRPRRKWAQPCLHTVYISVDDAEAVTKERQ